MRKTLSPLQITLLLLVSAVLVAWHVDTGWSASVDLAHHYALVFRIAETWQLVPDDPTLGEMNIYPRVSHLIAAVAGMLFGSPFLGLHASALASLALLWGAVIAILYALPGRAGLTSIAALVVLILVNHRFVGIDLHGAELANNYFYSQLMAQAFGMACVAVAIRLQERKRLYCYAFLLLAIVFLPYVHLLPAIELLALFGGLLFVDCLLYPGTARRRLLHAAACAAVYLVAIASVVLSPAFKVMRQISDNNGGLELVLFSTPAALALLCAICLAAAGWMLRSWLRDPARPATLKLLALYGAGIALLCLCQLVLRQFGIGSDYAVKKYAFGLTTFLLMVAVVACGMPLAAWLDRSARWRRLANDTAVTTGVLVLALVVAFSYSTRWRKIMDHSDVVAAERQLIAMRDAYLAPPPPGKHNVVFDLKGLPREMNYMFSIAITRTPREIALPILQEDNLRAPLGQYAHIVTTRGQPRFGRRDCAGTAGPLVAVTGECAAQARQDAGLCQGTVDFSQNGELDPAALSGFSGGEQHARWTSAPRATFTCKVRAPQQRARIAVTPFLARPQQRQRLAVSVNGGPALRHEFTQASSAATVVELPLPPVEPGATLVFTFNLPDAVSPMALGFGPDDRLLGVAVSTVSFE